MYGEPVGGKHLPDSLVYLNVVGDKIPSYNNRASFALRSYGIWFHILVGALQPACLAMRDYLLYLPVNWLFTTLDKILINRRKLAITEKTPVRRQW